MANQPLVELGIKRKDMYGSPEVASSSSKDYDNEEVFPSIHLDGPHAKMMGAEDLKKGEVFRQLVEFRVKERVKREVSGKPTEYSLTLEIVKAGDQEVCEDEDEEESSDSDDAGISYLESKAAKG